MKKPFRLFYGCNANSITPQMCESFQEALADKNLNTHVHPKDIKFMRSAVELFKSKSASGTIKELSSDAHGYSDLH